ncbi:hypothetical protein C1646_798202 [Rhizophagus diaphanus]|nr:hypothetical protein C1646_798202 [Rhizophagus diaphanus] [Rhizophagus sp. MUCL 43196]
MYCKRLDNFHSYHRDSHPTYRKQRFRFERACQTLPVEPNFIQVYDQNLKINKKNLDLLQNLTTDDLLRTTDSSQAEGTPINLPTQIRSNEGHTWHENLGILIPNDLLPYVTENPIYTSKRQEQLKVMDEADSHYRYKGHTSDDTKLLELRPHKQQHNNCSVTFDRRIVFPSVVRSKITWL